MLGLFKKSRVNNTSEIGQFKKDMDKIVRELQSSQNDVQGEIERFQKEKKDTNDQVIDLKAKLNVPFINTNQKDKIKIDIKKLEETLKELNDKLKLNITMLNDLEEQKKFVISSRNAQLAAMKQKEKKNAQQKKDQEEIDIKYKQTKLSIKKMEKDFNPSDEVINQRNLIADNLMRFDLDSNDGTDKYNLNLKKYLKTYSSELTKMENAMEATYIMNKPDFPKHIDESSLEKITDTQFVEYSRIVKILRDILKENYIKEDINIEISFIKSTNHTKLTFKDSSRRRTLLNTIDKNNNEMIDNIIKRLIAFQTNVELVKKQYYTFSQLCVDIKKYQILKWYKRVFSILKLILSTGSGGVFSSDALNIGSESLNLLAGTAAGEAINKILDDAKKNIKSLMSTESINNEINETTMMKPIYKTYCECDDKSYKTDLKKWMNKHPSYIHNENVNNNLLLRYTRSRKSQGKNSPKSQSQNPPKSQSQNPPKSKSHTRSSRN
jgi:hypothetical protein